MSRVKDSEQIFIIIYFFVFLNKVKSVFAVFSNKQSPAFKGQYSVVPNVHFSGRLAYTEQPPALKATFTVT